MVGLNFGGRGAYESDAERLFQPVDTCYNQYSNTVVPRESGVPYMMSWDQTYFDTVGASPFVVGVCRGVTPSILPCRFQEYQVMMMQCSSGVDIPWKTNLLESVIGNTWVESYRDRNWQSRSY